MSEKETKHCTEKIKGVCRWFNKDKGFGFLQKLDSDSQDIFFHQTDIKCEGFRSLDEGEEVEFTLVQGEKGPQAIEIVRFTKQSIK
ncbi:Cold shock-like protein [Candidatus Phytoplasma mali]|uniref:Cold shock-like protein n=1 Tax=Phytoplasma mali (strain AT) TaxID=482235 RepID=B3QZU5_PHYMT|nr:cold shock domain-containing protein [Candidatus Phytoplasma mali]CAP18482.1 Cold shock-like protein [Candidatus Phytoplasma mali]